MKQIGQILLDLNGPTNVVVGRLDGEAYFCAQGTIRRHGRNVAAVEMRDQRGALVWRDQRGHPGCGYGPGAYIHWIEGPGIDTPLVLYSFVPESDDLRGGARLLRAEDGQVVGELENTTRFGNNNSLAADLDNDGRVELLYADKEALTCYELPSLRQRWRYTEGVLFCWSLPALVDLPQGGTGIAFGSEYNNDDGASSMIMIDGGGKAMWRSDGHAEDLGSTPVFVADVDGDGQDELLKVGLDLEHRRQQQWNHLHVFDLQGRLKAEIALGFVGLALGDLDGDGHLKGVGLSNTRDGGNNGLREIRCVDLATGERKWARPVDRAYLDLTSPLAADVNGDGTPEVVVGTGNPAGYGRLPDSQPWGDLYVVRADGEIEQRFELPGRPVNLAFCDLNADGLAELVVVVDGQPGRLLVYATHTPTRRTDWPTAFGGPRRGGCFA